jgi:hypothetical protein
MKLLRYLGKKIDGFRLGAWEIGSGATPPWLLVRLLPTCKHFNYFRWRVQLWPRKRLATWHKITISRILALQALGVQSPRRPTMICLISPTFPGERTQVYACSRWPEVYQCLDVSRTASAQRNDLASQPFMALIHNTGQAI